MELGANELVAGMDAREKLALAEDLVKLAHEIVVEVISYGGECYSEPLRSVCRERPWLN